LHGRARHGPDGARGASVIATTLSDGVAMLIYAIISLGIGVAMIVGHNVWAGGLLPRGRHSGRLVDFPEGLSATSAAARHPVSGVDGGGLHKPQGADHGSRSSTAGSRVAHEM
jgi:hypothetical protein